MIAGGEGRICSGEGRCAPRPAGLLDGAQEGDEPVPGLGIAVRVNGRTQGTGHSGKCPGVGPSRGKKTIMIMV